MILFLLSFQIFDSLFCLTLGLCVCFLKSFFFILSRSMTCSLSLLVRACVCIFLFLLSFQIHDSLYLSLGACVSGHGSFWGGGGGNYFPAMGWVMGLREEEGERLQYLVLWRRPIFGAIFQDIARNKGLHFVSNASCICNYF